MATERQIRRVGAPVTVRRVSGGLDPVSSTRTSPITLDVNTVGVFRRPVQRSMQGDPLSTQETFYLVPASAFEGVFTPKDADLVIAGEVESRILAVRTRTIRGRVSLYELHVAGVAS